MSLESIQYQYKSPMRTGGHTQLACITVVFGFLPATVTSLTITHNSLSCACRTGVELKEAGLATHYLPSHALPHLLDQLHSLGPKARDLSVVNSILTEAETKASSSSSAAAAGGAGGGAATAAAGGGAAGGGVGASLPLNSKLQQQLPSINKAFGNHHKSVGEVLEELDKGTWDVEWSRSTHQGLLK
jgi:hypothetical protein